MLNKKLIFCDCFLIFIMQMLLRMNFLQFSAFLWAISFCIFLDFLYFSLFFDFLEPNFGLIFGFFGPKMPAIGC